MGQCRSRDGFWVVWADKDAPAFPYGILSHAQTGNCGWGLKSLVDIKKGEFIIEYTGEVCVTRRLAGKGVNLESDGWFVTRVLMAGAGHLARRVVSPRAKRVQGLARLLLPEL